MRALGALLLFAALTAYHTWPLAEAPSRRIHGNGDAVFSLWAINELSYRLVHEPAQPMDGNAFHPFRGALAMLDHNFTSALLVAPLAEAGVDGLLLYNVIVLSSFVLSGFFTFLLVRRLTGSNAAGLIAGCGFAFGSYRVLHVPQSHLLATQWLPLALLLLDRYLERPNWGRWTAFAMSAIALALTSWHLAVIGAVGVAIVSLWSMAALREGVSVRLRGLVLVTVLCAAVLLPLAVIYARVGERWPPPTGDGRETTETLASMSPDLAGLVTVPEASRAPYVSVASALTASQPGVFPGFVLVALAMPALGALRRLRDGASSRRGATIARWAVRLSAALVVLIVVAALAGDRSVVAALRPISPFVLLGLALAILAWRAARRTSPGSGLAPILAYAVLAAAGALLALGPTVQLGSTDLGSGLWRFDLLPVRLMIRAPERLALLLSLGMAVLAGFGAARLLPRMPPRVRGVALAALLAALNLELAFASPPLVNAPGVSAAERWLALAPEDGAVVAYPLGQSRIRTAFATRRHGRRVVNGGGYLRPAPYLELNDLPDFSPEQLRLLWEHFHPRFVVVNLDLYDPEERAGAIEAMHARSDALVPRFVQDDQHVFELVDRGRGEELFRRWPRELLEHRGALELEAGVSAGRNDTGAVLVVSLNGRTLLETPVPGASRSTTFRAAFTSGDLVDDVNSFRIEASYRFRDPADAHPIGSTGVRVAADVAVASELLRSTVYVNGRLFRPDRGYFLAVLDAATGRVVDTGGFDVSWETRESDALVSFIRAIPEGAPVVVATEFDASRELSAGAVHALRSLGLAVDLRGRFQTMHAAIGVKGAAPGTGLEVSERLTATLSLGQMDTREVQLSSVGLSSR